MNKIKLIQDGATNYKPEIISFDKENNTKKEIDESEIENTIKDSWKELENLSSKISDIKAQLLNKPKKENVLNKFRKEEEIECNIYLLSEGSY